MRKLAETNAAFSAWLKSKAALFEFSEAHQGFTIIKKHMVPRNGLLFCTGEEQCLLALCSVLLQ